MKCCSCCSRILAWFYPPTKIEKKGDTPFQIDNKVKASAGVIPITSQFAENDGLRQRNVQQSPPVEKASAVGVQTLVNKIESGKVLKKPVQTAAASLEPASLAVDAGHPYYQSDASEGAGVQQLNLPPKPPKKIPTDLARPVSVESPTEPGMPVSESPEGVSESAAGVNSSDYTTIQAPDAPSMHRRMNRLPSLVLNENE